MNDTSKSTSAAILDGLEVSHAVLTAVHDSIDEHDQAGGH